MKDDGVGAGGTSTGIPPSPTSKAASIVTTGSPWAKRIPRRRLSGVQPKVVISPCQVPFGYLLITNRI